MQVNTSQFGQRTWIFKVNRICHWADEVVEAVVTLIQPVAKQRIIAFKAGAAIDTVVEATVADARIVAATVVAHPIVEDPSVGR